MDTRRKEQIRQDIENDPLNPGVWKSAGKALGWGTTKGAVYFVGHITLTEWQYKAHQYFDLILTGGDVEAFWKELLAVTETKSNVPPKKG